MGAAAIPLILSIVGTGASIYNQNQVAKGQDEAAAQGIRFQAENQRQADTQVDETVSKLAESSPEASRAKATGDFLEQLRRTRSQAVPVGVPGGSNRYDQDIASAETDVADFGTRAASLLGRINAPGMQREAEGQSFGRLATGLNTINRNSGADAFLTDLRARSVRANPWVSAAGSLATGAGSGLAESGYGTAPKTGKPIRRVGTPTGMPVDFNAPRKA